MEIPLLKDIVILFGLSVIVLYGCHRFNIPTIVGFLVTGMVVGPYGLKLIRALHEVEMLAEIGVVLLLFTIGIEFSLEKLLQIKKTVLVGGSLQVGLTSVVAFFLVQQFAIAGSTGETILLGFLIALSSTAVVLKLLQERAEVDSPHGGITLGILIFQDIIIVPMILVTPFLAGSAIHLHASMAPLLAKGILIIGLVLITAKWVVPRLLYQVARTRNHELFLLSVVVICFGVAWLTAQAGLSLALGAFLAGLIISESEYSHHALGNILPFRDVFTTFFFVSIGMMLDLGFLFRQILPILLMTGGVLLLKSLIAGIVALILGFPLRTGILVGLALGQIGEFSFILSRVGLENGLLGGDIYQQFLSVTILSMASTPFLLALGPHVAAFVARLPLPSGLKRPDEAIGETSPLSDHLVIIGFGVNGRNVARAARAAGIPYTIIEFNPDTVRKEQARGEPIFYGDATREPVLSRARIETARVVVVAINDPTATRHITELVRRLNPSGYLIVRTRYVQEVHPLYELGANEVIPEEFETSVEIFTRVLAQYLIPKDEIEKLVSHIRADGYQMFRSLWTSRPMDRINLQLPEVEISAVRLPQHAPLVGKTLAQLDFRKQFGVSVVAIRRGKHVFPNPDPDQTLQSNDVLILLGKTEPLNQLIRYLETSSTPPDGTSLP